MLTPALRVGEPDPQAHGPHLCEHRPLSGNQRPRRLNAPTPTLATVAEATPPRTGCPSCTVTQAAGRHAMVVAHFFESGQRRRLRWASRERTANGGAVALAAQVHSCDRRKGWRATSARPGVQGSHSVSRHCHGDSSRAEYASASRVILLERGWIAAQLRPPGQAVVRRTVP